MEKRETVRIILLNPKKQILLQKINDFKNSKHPLWITSGGGVNPGETHKQAIERELYEETGIQDSQILEPAVWYGETALQTRVGYKKFFQCHFYIAHTKSIKIHDSNMESYEKSILQEMRWWSLEEIQNSKEIFIPTNLGDLLEALFKENLKVDKTKNINVSFPGDLT